MTDMKKQPSVPPINVPSVNLAHVEGSDIPKRTREGSPKFNFTNLPAYGVAQGANQEKSDPSVSVPKNEAVKNNFSQV